MVRSVLATEGVFIPECTCTLLKSWPKRPSINSRVPASSGCPGEPNTSWTMGGTAGDGDAGWVELRCKLNRFSRHSSHSPSTPGAPPQAHFRCKSPVWTVANVCGSTFLSCTGFRSLICFALLHAERKNAFIGKTSKVPLLYGSWAVKANCVCLGSITAIRLIPENPPSLAYRRVEAARLCLRR